MRMTGWIALLGLHAVPDTSALSLEKGALSSAPPWRDVVAAAHAESSSSSSTTTPSASSSFEEALEELRGYDAHPSMFAPSGRILQIEYAMEAVNLGRPVAGIRAHDGVVLVGRKTVESKKLQDMRLRQKLYQVDNHIVAAATGVTADAMTLIRYARSFAQDYLRVYGEPIPVRHLVERLCDVKHICTMLPRRPFGVALLVAGWDPMRGYQLYKTDPSANYGAWVAAAAGAGQESLTSELARRLHADEQEEKAVRTVRLEDACRVACKLLAHSASDATPEEEHVQDAAHGVEPGAVLEMAVVRDGKVYMLGMEDVCRALDDDMGSGQDPSSKGTAAAS